LAGRPLLNVDGFDPIFGRGLDAFHQILGPPKEMFCMVWKSALKENTEKYTCKFRFSLSLSFSFNQNPNQNQNQNQNQNTNTKTKTKTKTRKKEAVDEVQRRIEALECNVGPKISRHFRHIKDFTVLLRNKQKKKKKNAKEKDIKQTKQNTFS